MHDVTMYDIMCTKYKHVHYNKLNYVFAGFKTFLLTKNYQIQSL